MDNVLKEFLESDALDANLKTSLQEAWDAKLEEARVKVREEVEEDVRSEFTRRYETDREKMVEAMDKFLGESIEKELREFNEDRKEVYAAKAKLAKQIRENQKEHAEKIQNSSNLLETFVLNNIKKELEEFSIDRKELAEQKRETRKAIAESKKEMQSVTADRINSMEKFIMKKISEELKEFESDKKALIEQKVKLAKEAKSQISEAKKSFIKRSAALVENHLMDSMRKEFTEMKEDIKEARQNHFGRKIFEAYAAEYMTSYLAEGSEIKKLEKQLVESKKQTEDALSTLTKQQGVISKLNTTLKESAEKVNREKVMRELLSPLGKEHSSIMEGILEHVKTDRLRESFNKHLPAVLKETAKPSRKSTEDGRAKLTEATGNKVASKENAVTENEELDSVEIIRLQQVAGIKQ